MNLKVWTVVGTRPEIIRLAPTIKLFDKIYNHTLIHTGQNFGTQMSDVFFSDLDLRAPDFHLGVRGENLGELMGQIFSKFGNLLEADRPDALVVLGDTNSALVTIIARRLRIATYHLEAGNRAFDSRVPEETNRRIIDHTADFNLVYNTHSFQNLVREGLHPSRIFVTGSPMREVITSLAPKIRDSRILNDLGISQGDYIVGSFHRQENVDSLSALDGIVSFLNELSRRTEKEVIMPLHPRTLGNLKKFGLDFSKSIRTIDPLGVVDYLALQASSFATISDSGTLAEESSILGFAGVSARESTERPEAFHQGAIGLSSRSVDNCLESIQLAKLSGERELPEGYEERRFSVRVANILSSTVRRRDFLTGDSLT